MCNRHVHASSTALARQFGLNAPCGYRQAEAMRRSTKTLSCLSCSRFSSGAMNALRTLLLAWSLAHGLAGCSAAGTGSGAPVIVGGLAFRSMEWQVSLARLPPEQDEPALQRELQRILDDANDTLSTYQPETELMRFNRAPIGHWQPVSPLLLQGVQTAVAAGALSDGAYDITVGPLVELWGFGASPAQGIPDAAAIAAAQARVGRQHLGIDPARAALQRRADIRLDLSSVGEGLAVDALAEFLERQGVQDYLVRVAGTLRARGTRTDGSPWRVAVETPDGSGRPLRVLRLRDQVVSTSGAYRQFREAGGRRYTHTLDARTGHPVTHRGVSVTVVAPAATGAARADALATALNVLGPDAGLALAEREHLAVLYLEASDTGLRQRPSPAFAAPGFSD